MHGQRVLRVPASRSPGRRAQPHPVSAASLLTGLQLPLRQGGGGGSAAGRRLAVAWYVITFVLCVWLWPSTSSLLCFVVGCGLVRHHFCALLWPGTSSRLCFVVGCGLVRHHFCAL